MLQIVAKLNMLMIIKDSSNFNNKIVVLFAFYICLLI